MTAESILTLVVVLARNAHPELLHTHAIATVLLQAEERVVAAEALTTVALAINGTTGAGNWSARAVIDLANTGQGVLTLGVADAGDIDAQGCNASAAGPTEKIFIAVKVRTAGAATGGGNAPATCVAIAASPAHAAALRAVLADQGPVLTDANATLVITVSVVAIRIESRTLFLQVALAAIGDGADKDIVAVLAGLLVAAEVTEASQASRGSRSVIVGLFRSNRVDDALKVAHQLSAELHDALLHRSRSAFASDKEVALRRYDAVTQVFDRNRGSITGSAPTTTIDIRTTTIDRRAIDGNHLATAGKGEKERRWQREC